MALRISGLEPFISHKGFLWKRNRDPYDHYFDGPFCATCKTRLSPAGYCVSCKEHKIPKESLINVQDELDALYEARENNDTPVITLETAISNIKDIEKDEFHEVKVFLSQKDGRKSAMVLIIDRKAQGEKAHIILDLEKEEVRYDPNDISPGKIIAKMKVWFQTSESEISYKEPAK